MALKDIVFGLKLNDSNFQKGIQGANKGLKKLDNQRFPGLRKGFKNLQKDLKSFADGFAKRMKSLAVGGAAVAGIGVGIGMAINKAMNAAIDARQIDAQLKNSLSKIGAAGAFDGLNDLSARMQKAFVLDDEETRAGFKVLIDGGMKVADVYKNAALVADVARANNMSFAEASETVSKAFNGEMRALKQVGIFMKSTGDRTKDAQIAMTVLQQKFGGAAAAAAGAMSPFESFKLTMADTVQLIGEKLLPVIEPMIASFGAWFEQMANSGQMEEWILKFTDGIKTAIDFARFLGQTIGNIFSAFQDGTMGDFLVEVIKAGIETAKAGFTYIGEWLGNAIMYGAPKIMAMLSDKLIDLLQNTLGPRVSGLLGLDKAKAISSEAANDTAYADAQAKAAERFQQTGGSAMSKLADSAFNRFAGDGGTFEGGDGGAGMRTAQQQMYAYGRMGQQQAAPQMQRQRVMSPQEQYARSFLPGGARAKPQRIQLISQQPMSAVSIH